jgi:hypothetical protein
MMDEPSLLALKVLRGLIRQREADLVGPGDNPDVILPGDAPLSTSLDPEVAAGNKRLIEHAALMYEALRGIYAAYAGRDDRDMTLGEGSMVRIIARALRDVEGDDAE